MGCIPMNKVECRKWMGCIPMNKVECRKWMGCIPMSSSVDRDSRRHISDHRKLVFENKTLSASIQPDRR